MTKYNSIHIHFDNQQYFYLSLQNSINKTNLFRSLRHSSVVSAGSRDIVMTDEQTSKINIWGKNPNSENSDPSLVWHCLGIFN